MRCRLRGACGCAFAFMRALYHRTGGLLAYSYKAACLTADICLAGSNYALMFVCLYLYPLH